MKKILYLSTCDIANRSGAGLATLAYYNAFCSLFPKLVDLIMPQEMCSDKFPAIPVPKRNKVKALLSGSLHRYKGFMRSFLKENHSLYDMCVLNGGVYAGELIDIFHKYGIKVMVIHHNLEREYHMDNKSVFTLWGLTPILINIIEKKAYTRADVNCFLTKSDAETFKKYYGECLNPSHIIGVFEPTSEPLPNLDNAISQNIFAITGSMDIIQTMLGLRDLRKNYYDIISRLCPEWTILVAGRNPQAEAYRFKSLSPSKIEVIPNPENMSSITDKASIFLCPTNVGGGLKLRVMDGLRQGLPILVHTVSSRGYDIFFDKPFFKCYNDRISFESGLKDLLLFCQKGFDRKDIQNIYRNEFGFEQGCKRVQKAMSDMI